MPEHRLHCPCVTCWNKAESQPCDVRTVDLRKEKPKPPRVRVTGLTHAERAVIRRQKVAMIRVLRAEGKTFRELADIFGTTPQAVHSLLGRS